MFNKYLIITIIIILSLSLTSVTISSDSTKLNGNNSLNLSNIESILTTTGFSVQDGFDLQKDIIHLKSLKNYDSSILITDKNYECPIWQLTINRPHILLDNWEIDTNFIKDYTIYIEEKNQQVIEIWGVCYRYFDSLNISINYDSLIKYYSDNNMLIVDSVEGYQGVPDEKPKITFVQALSKHLFGSPYLAKLIIGKYVLYSCNNSETKSAWAIHLYGLHPMFSNNGKGYTEWRTIVDAQNGNVLWSSSGSCANLR